MSSDPREDAVARRMMEVYSGDPEVRAAMAVESVSAEIRRPGLHLAEVVETVMSSYAERPALGRRAFEYTVDPATGRCAAPLPTANSGNASARSPAHGITTRK